MDVDKDGGKDVTKDGGKDVDKDGGKNGYKDGGKDVDKDGDHLPEHVAHAHTRLLPLDVERGQVLKFPVSVGEKTYTTKKCTVPKTDFFLQNCIDLILKILNL